MKTLLLTFIVASNLLTMAPSFAAAKGNSSGGGGNAIVCFDSPDIVKQIKVNKQFGGGYIENGHISHITSVELLDISKAKLALINSDDEIIIPELIEAAPGDTMGSFTKKMEKRLKLYPGVLNLVEAGKKKVKSVKGVPNGLTPIDDITSGEATKTDYCVRSTIIAQYDEGNETNVLFDLRIFGLSTDIFPVESRAMAFWHEYLYLLARKNGDTSSDLTQTLVGSLLKKDLTVRELEESYWSFKMGTKLNNSFINGSYIEELDESFSMNVEKNVKIPVYSEEQKCLGVACSFSAVKAELAEKALSKVNTEEARASVLSFYKSSIQEKIYATPNLSKATANKIDNFYQNKIKSMKAESKCTVEGLHGGVDRIFNKYSIKCTATTIIPMSEREDLRKLLTEVNKTLLPNEL
jgi:hypothetical protein